MDIIKRLRLFLRDLKSGKKIKITKVKRENTPDGPLHSKEIKWIKFS